MDGGSDGSLQAQVGCLVASGISCRAYNLNFGARHGFGSAPQDMLAHQQGSMNLSVLKKTRLIQTTSVGLLSGLNKIFGGKSGEQHGGRKSSVMLAADVTSGCPP